MKAKTMNKDIEIRMIPMVRGNLLSFIKDKENLLFPPDFCLDLGSFLFLKVFDLGVSEAIVLCSQSLYGIEYK